MNRAASHPTPSHRRQAPIARAAALALVWGLGAAAAAAPSQGDGGRVLRLWEHLDTGGLRLASRAALVVDEFGNALYAKDPDTPRPMASVTKLMTSIVVLDRRQDLREVLSISAADRDHLRGTGSRLAPGVRLPRGELLRLMLMSSENRAAAALARSYPGGTPRFVEIMNLKARLLGLRDTRFADPAGLSTANVSPPRDLARLARAARRYPLIRESTTTRGHSVRPGGAGPLFYANTNPLVRNGGGAWDIGLSKTGYLDAAGHCLVMQAEVAGQFVVLVLMDAPSRAALAGDAERIRSWLEGGVARARRARAPDEAPGDA
jgi:D-alanyl-D-alanine endopeptidase (penicillin-binding protein 7)